MRAVSLLYLSTFPTLPCWRQDFHPIRTKEESVIWFRCLDQEWRDCLNLASLVNYCLLFTVSLLRLGPNQPVHRLMNAQLRSRKLSNEPERVRVVVDVLNATAQSQPDEAPEYAQWRFLRPGSPVVFSYMHHLDRTEPRLRTGSTGAWSTAASVDQDGAARRPFCCFSLADAGCFPLVCRFEGWEKLSG